MNRLEESYLDLIKHAEEATGKLINDISYNQLRTLKGFNTSLESRASRAKILKEKLKKEQNITKVNLLDNRWNSWKSRGSPVNEVSYDKDGNPILLAEKVV